MGVWLSLYIRGLTLIRLDYFGRNFSFHWSLWYRLTRNIRERTQRRRRRQRIYSAKQQLCTCSTLFCTFLCRYSTTTAWKCLISRFMLDVNTRQRFSFSFCELRNSPLEFNSWKIRQHLTNWKSWNRSDEVWNSANSLFGWWFRCRCREMHLLPILLKLNTQGTFLKLLKTLKARVLNIT